MYSCLNRQSVSLIQLARSFLAILAMTALTGCTGFHLHNSADEGLAKKAQDSFKAADITGLINAERKTVTTANERDIAVVKRNMQAERDAILIFALENETTGQKLVQFLTQRLSDRGIPIDDQEGIRALHDLEQLRHAALSARKMYALTALEARLPYPSFPPSKKDIEEATKKWDSCPSPPVQPTNVQRPWCTYQTKATEYSKALDKASSYETGELGQLNKALHDAENLRGQVIEDTRNAKNDLETAKKQYQSQATSADPKLEAAEKAVNGALKKFDDLSAKYTDEAKKNNLTDLLAIVHLEKLKTIRGAIGEYLASYQEDLSQASADTSTATPTVDKKEATSAAGRTAAVLVKANKDIQNASIHAKLVPLLFEQERLRIEIDYGEKAVSRASRRIEALERQREELIRESMKLIDATKTIKDGCNAFEDPNRKCDLAKDSVFGLISNNKSGSYLVHSLLVLSESVVIHKRKRREAEVELIALDHEESLDNSEYALKLWAHMIAVPIEELVAYHSSGLKSQDVANLIHAAGLAGIAVGVNR
jgi:hypothetical protein